MNILKITIICIMLFVIATPGLFAQNINVGDIAPSFQLSQFGGGMVNSADFTGKIIFLHFLGSY